MAVKEMDKRQSRIQSVLLGVLLVLGLRSVDMQTLKPVLTITPRSLRLKFHNDTFDQVVSVRCSTGISNVGKLSSVKQLTILHKFDGSEGAEYTVTEATDVQKIAELKGFAIESNKYMASGSLGTPQTASEITFSIQSAMCDDAGKYSCRMMYTIAESSVVQEGAVEGYIDLAPYQFTVSRTNSKKPIAVGDQLVLTCEGVVGTVKNDELYRASHLQWVYRSRESAIQNVYSALEGDLQHTVKLNILELVLCSERQLVTMRLTVDEIRDSLRDYFCVAARYKDANRATYLGGGLHTNISMPSFEKPKPKTLGIGSFVGIGLAGLALLSGSTFGFIWCVRRKKKKMQRKTELESRKSLIDERRKSIASIVERRKSEMVMEMASEAESSVIESSVADSSAAPPETSEVPSAAIGPTYTELTRQ